MVRVVGPVEEAILNVLQSDNLRGWVNKLVNEEVLRITEDTDLVSAVAKAETEERANVAMQQLQSKGINARVKYPVILNPFDKSEREGWGIMVRPAEVRDAGDVLSSNSQGLTFDPYLHTARK